MSDETATTLPEIATTRQVADFLQVSPRSVTRLAEEGIVRPIVLRPGSPFRFLRVDILAMIESRKLSA